MKTKFFSAFFVNGLLLLFLFGVKLSEAQQPILRDANYISAECQGWTNSIITMDPTATGSTSQVDGVFSLSRSNVVDSWLVGYNFLNNTSLLPPAYNGAINNTVNASIGIVDNNPTQCVQTTDQMPYGGLTQVGETHFGVMVSGNSGNNLVLINFLTGQTAGVPILSDSSPAEVVVSRIPIPGNASQYVVYTSVPRSAGSNGAASQVAMMVSKFAVDIATMTITSLGSFDVSMIATSTPHQAIELSPNGDLLFVGVGQGIGLGTANSRVNIFNVENNATVVGVPTIAGTIDVLGHVTALRFSAATNRLYVGSSSVMGSGGQLQSYTLFTGGLNSHTLHFSRLGFTFNDIEVFPSCNSLESVVAVGAAIRWGNNSSQSSSMVVFESDGTPVSYNSDPTLMPASMWDVDIDAVVLTTPTGVVSNYFAYTANAGTNPRTSRFPLGVVGLPNLAFGVCMSPFVNGNYTVNVVNAALLDGSNFELMENGQVVLQGAAEAVVESFAYNSANFYCLSYSDVFCGFLMCYEFCWGGQACFNPVPAPVRSERSNSNSLLESFEAENLNTISVVPAPVPAFELYPNPSKGIVTIQLHEKFAEGTVFEIHTTTGQLVDTFRLVDSSQQTLQKDFGSLPAGMYVVSTQKDGLVIKTNFVKE